MKKIPLLLTLALVIIIGGCVSHPAESISKKDQETATKASNQILPEMVLYTHQHYTSLQAENNFTYTVSNNVAFEENSHYNIIASGQDKIHFPIQADGTVNNSYTIIFDNETENDKLKDLITATIMIADSSLDIDAAQDTMNQMINECSRNDGYSGIFLLGDYSIFLTKYFNGFESEYKLVVSYKEDFNQPVNESEYKALDYTSATNELNIGEKTIITGTLAEIGIFHSISFRDTLRVVDGAGNDYYVYFDIADFPLDFELGREYTLFGTVAAANGSAASIRLEYVR